MLERIEDSKFKRPKPKKIKFKNCLIPLEREYLNKILNTNKMKSKINSSTIMEITELIKLYNNKNILQ